MSAFHRKQVYAAFVVVSAFTTCSQLLMADGIVDSIVKAPIAPDGNVAGAVPDFVINLDTSFDPAVEGRSLAAGNTIKIVLPTDFVDGGTLPTETVFSSATCTIGNFQCDTSVFVQGWPQRPIRPVSPVDSSAVYSLTNDGTHTFVHTADVNVVPGLPAPGPGIKQIHMILPGFTNPPAGTYDIEVIAETGVNGAVETGTGQLEILAEVEPSINPTSIYSQNQNIIYQTAQQGELAPLPWDFFLWDGDGAAFTGVEINNGQLVKDSVVVGSIMTDAPPGASGHEVFTDSPSVPANEPFFGVEAGRLTAFFRAGDVNGEYVTTISLNGGNSAKFFTTVVPEPSTLLLVCLTAVALLVYGRRRLGEPV